jgi:hypothetical protein
MSIFQIYKKELKKKGEKSECEQNGHNLVFQKFICDDIFLIKII